MYKLAIKESLDRKLKRLRTKDKELLRLLDKKVNNILDDPYRFKPLRKPLQNKRRVHVAGPFVLMLISSSHSHSRCLILPSPLSFIAPSDALLLVDC